MARTVLASEFEAKCLALLDRVAETGEPLVITKRGKAVARVEPVEPPPSLVGTARQHVSDEELVEPLYETRDPSWPA